MKKMLFLLLFGSVFVANGMEYSDILAQFSKSYGTYTSVQKYGKISFKTFCDIMNCVSGLSIPDHIRWSSDCSTSSPIRITNYQNGNSEVLIPGGTGFKQTQGAYQGKFVCADNDLSFNLVNFDYEKFKSFCVESTNGNAVVTPYTPPSLWDKYVPKNKKTIGLALLGAAVLTGFVGVYYKWLRGK